MRALLLQFAICSQLLIGGAFAAFLLPKSQTRSKKSAGSRRRGGGVCAADGREHEEATKTITPPSQEDDRISCRIKGFYPFPSDPPKGPLLGWILRDTHQAILVESTSSSGTKRRTLLDFMTEGGAFHPVWFEERVKWSVVLGGNIRGEVRVRVLGKHKNNAEEEQVTCPKMERLLQFAQSYDCDMNIYRNNCRMFCARMEREVERLNGETTDGHSIQTTQEILLADVRCAMRILGAALLPTLYPFSVLLLSYEGLHDLL